MTENPGAPVEDGAPVGPSETEEAAFLSEQRDQGFSAPAAKAATEAVVDDKTSLPPLDELVSRIPGPARQLLDELFRAKFVTVKRVPASALKN